ncbi:MAG: NAD-dependent epimerase/dehydratase family protein [Sphingobacteriales bacterium]|nr:MAG: NAD-dependent epimerase/dehydratase family protein [Sphingobacteriales bacterium]
MEKSNKIFVAGHRGMVGSSIVRKLEKEGYTNIITRTSAELDLTNQQAVSDFFVTEKPEFVFLAAAKVGGILANNIYRAEFLYKNLMIESNIIHSAYENKVEKMYFISIFSVYFVAIAYLLSSLGTALANDWSVFLVFRFLGGLCSLFVLFRVDQEMSISSYILSINYFIASTF